MMPGPIVDEIDAEIHSLPLQPVGRFFSMTAERAIRFSVSLASSKSTYSRAGAHAQATVSGSGEGIGVQIGARELTDGRGGGCVAAGRARRGATR